MIADGLVDAKRLRDLFLEARSVLCRYPAIDPDTLAKRVDEWAARE